MSQASLREGAAGELQLAGVLDYSSGPALREQGGRLIRASQAAELVVDCSAVERSSSVGISLLLAFMRDARKAGKVLSVRALPDDMRGDCQGQQPSGDPAFAGMTGRRNERPSVCASLPGVRRRRALYDGRPCA